MRIGNLVLHSCARAYKLGWQLLAQGNEVHLVTERIFGSHPWRDFHTTNVIWTGYNFTEKFDREQLKATCKALDPIIDLWHVHNEPDFMVAELREMSKKPIIWDIHDMKSQRDGHVEKEEQSALDACDGISVVSQRYKDIIATRTDKPCEEILNAVPSWLFPTVRRKLQFPGIVYEGGLRGRQAHSEHIPTRNWLDVFKYLTGEGIPVFAYSNHAGEDLTEYGQNGIITFPPLEYTDMLKNLTAHEVGLVGSPVESKWFDGALPNKFFEYIAAGLPIISINAPDVANFIEATGIGIGVDKMEDIPKALEEIREAKVCGEPLRDYIWNHFRHWWSLEKQMPKLESLYQRAAEKWIQTLPEDECTSGPSDSTAASGS